ncbi:uncharacterized protein LOC124153871 [Ischnura elegans]|uniref:uncharacterized protein LOC124153871 n=1 Tax=Ischnura elegans TaxID=197161 RepID=UPI001ED8AB2A|nr:uncharacterized protein LOC124153871 [Ischnura elegans]
MAFRAIVLCVALIMASSNAGRVVRGSGSYSSSSSSSSSGAIHFGNPGQAYSGSSSGGFAQGPLGSFSTGPHMAFSGFNQGQPDLGTRGGFDDVGSTGNSGMKGVYTSSSSSVDSDGKIHYSVQSGRF